MIPPTLVRNPWLAGELAIAIGVLIVAYRALRVIPRLEGKLRRASLVVALPVTVVASLLYCREALQLVRRRPEVECLRELGEVLRGTLPSAVVFYADKQPSDQRYLGLMFWADRAVYSTTLHLRGRSLDSAAAWIRAQGGVPLLLAEQGPPENQLATCTDGRKAIYRLPTP